MKNKILLLGFVVLAALVLAGSALAVTTLLWTRHCPGYVETYYVYPGFDVYCYGESETTAIPTTASTSVPTSTPSPAVDRRIDHTDVDDFNAIPLVSGKRMGWQTRVVFYHKSVGEGIDWGLRCIGGLLPTQTECKPYSDSGYDRSNFYFPYLGDGDKLDYYVSAVNSVYQSYDVLAFKYCYLDGAQDSPIFWQDFSRVRQAIDALQAQYPDKIFPIFTMPLAAIWYPGIQQYNDAVRAYAINNPQVWIFDIADIESHTPDNTACLDNQGHEVMCAEYLQTGATGGHPIKLGRIRLAKAFWVMIFRMSQ